MPVLLSLINVGEPSDVRTFEKGRVEIYAVCAMTMGRATYELGWRREDYAAPSS